MDIRPFTLDEAVEICDDFEDLTDTEFYAPDGRLVLVDHVLVCPFGETERQMFVQLIIAATDSGVALQAFPGDAYDVILLVSPADDEANRYDIDIRTYAREKGVKYAFPE